MRREGRRHDLVINVGVEGFEIIIEKSIPLLANKPDASVITQLGLCARMLTVVHHNDLGPRNGTGLRSPNQLP